VYEETFYPLTQQGACGGVAPIELAEYRRHVKQKEDAGEAVEFDALQLVSFLDYENECDNPVEDKYRVSAIELETIN
jgi:hypothetical protein